MFAPTLTFHQQCLWSLGGGPFLVLDRDTIQRLNELGVPYVQEILVRHFMYFGPLPEGLLKHVDDELWSRLYKEASMLAETEAAEDPTARLKDWTTSDARHLDPEAKDMIINMTRLDPAQRASMDEVLQHPWWRRKEGADASIPPDSALSL